MMLTLARKTVLAGIVIAALSLAAHADEASAVRHAQAVQGSLTALQTAYGDLINDFAAMQKDLADTRTKLAAAEKELADIRAKAAKDAPKPAAKPAPKK